TSRIAPIPPIYHNKKKVGRTKRLRRVNPIKVEIMAIHNYVKVRKYLKRYVKRPATQQLVARKRGIMVHKYSLLHLGIKNLC
ncbi:hypothetical protein Leryth_022113, partial [Lithospermum erythrorhizon]